MTTTVSSCQRPAQPLLRRGSFPRSLRHHRQSCTAIVRYCRRRSGRHNSASTRLGHGTSPSCRQRCPRQTACRRSCVPMANVDISLSWRTDSERVISFVGFFKTKIICERDEIDGVRPQNVVGNLFNKSFFCGASQSLSTRSA